MQEKFRGEGFKRGGEGSTNNLKNPSLEGGGGEGWRLGEREGGALRREGGVWRGGVGHVPIYAVLSLYIGTYLH